MKAGSILDGKYELVRRIGDGRMGALWEGRNIRTEREVAVKLLLASGRDEDKQRLLREARAGGRIRHPNVLDVYDVAETEAGSPFIVMELLRGETLAQRIERQPLPLGEALRILRDVARGIGAAHKVGVVHRDLQPKNIFLHDEADARVPTVKLVEFSISRIDTEATLAVKGATTIGSPGYIAPEQAYGKHVDARTDIWAFGVLAFELLTGTPLFDGASIGEIIHQVTTGAISELPPIAPEIDADLALIVSSCVVRDIDQRPGAILDVLTIIERVQDRLSQPDMVAIAGRRPASAADEDGPTTVLNGTTAGRAVAKATRVSITEIKVEPGAAPAPRALMPSDSDEHPMPTRNYHRPQMDSAPTRVAGAPVPRFAEGTPTDADVEIAAGSSDEEAASDDDIPPDTLVTPKALDDHPADEQPEDAETEEDALPRAPKVQPRKPSDSLLDPQSDRASASRRPEPLVESEHPPPPRRPLVYIVLGVLVAMSAGVGVLAYMRFSSPSPRASATGAVSAPPSSVSTGAAAATETTRPVDTVALPTATATATASATAEPSASDTASAAASESAKPKPHLPPPVVIPHPPPILIPQPPPTNFTPSSL